MWDWLASAGRVPSAGACRPRAARGSVLEALEADLPDEEPGDLAALGRGRALELEAELDVRRTVSQGSSGLTGVSVGT